jgi:hypothetical protein
MATSAAPQPPQIEKWAVDMVPPQPIAAPMPTQQSVVSGADYLPIAVKRDPHFLDREPPVSAEVPSRSDVSLYGRDPALSSYSSRLGRAVAGGSLVTQVQSCINIYLNVLFVSCNVLENVTGMYLLIPSSIQGYYAH